MNSRFGPRTTRELCASRVPIARSLWRDISGATSGSSIRILGPGDSLWDVSDFRWRPRNRLTNYLVGHGFGYPEFSAAPNLYESLADFHRLNSGVFAAKPSCRTYESMLARLDQSDAFWKRTDQTFLEAWDELLLA